MGWNDELAKKQAEQDTTNANEYEYNLTHGTYANAASTLNQRKQINYAQNFRNYQMPGTESKMLGQLGTNNSQQLGQSLRQSRYNANSRGLLNSGMEMGAEGALRNTASKNMATGTQNIRRGLMTQADSFDKQAVQSGIDLQKSQQDIQDTIYKTALADAAGYNSAMGSFANAATTLGAMYAFGPYAAATGV